METGGSQSPVSKGREGISETDVKGKTGDELKETKKKQQEVNLKKINASLVSLEKYNEQLKAVKKKV